MCKEHPPLGPHSTSLSQKTKEAQVMHGAACPMGELLQPCPVVPDCPPAWWGRMGWQGPPREHGSARAHNRPVSLWPEICLLEVRPGPPPAFPEGPSLQGIAWGTTRHGASSLHRSAGHGRTRQPQSQHVQVRPRTSERTKGRLIFRGRNSTGKIEGLM